MLYNDRARPLVVLGHYIHLNQSDQFYLSVVYNLRQRIQLIMQDLTFDPRVGTKEA